jgi:hypothetical protein
VRLLTKLAAFALFSGVLPPALVGAATINAASAALTDVTTAVAAAVDGDTVIVPAGTASWTSVLTITKGITLQGATTVTNAGTQNPTASDLTVIKDDSPLDTIQSGLIKVDLTPNQSFRLTGFTFASGVRTTLNDNGVVQLTSDTNSAPVTNVRVDHCHFDHIYGRNIQTGGWVYGVADHNYIVAQGNGQSFFINDGTYGGYQLGHGAWADYPWFGTAKFFFFEDNTVVGNGIVTTSGTTDAEYGARFVVRHNYLSNANVGCHGTEGSNRGGRAFEMYDNVSNWTIIPSAQLRSGTALIHDNTWTGTAAGTPTHTSIVIYRENGGVPANTNYAPADGTSPWDANDTEGNGTYVEGHSPHLFISGQASTTGSISGGQATMTDATKSWTVDQWAGYSITQTNPLAASYQKSSYIISNTAHTITYYYYSATDRGPNLTFAAGDSYQIHRVVTALDQGGRGKGDLLSGGSMAAPINTVTGTMQWPHQALEPAMSWNNVYTPTGVAYGFDSAIPTELGGRDYYNLGKGFSVDTTPSQVSTIYTATLNGVAYTGTYIYPHPLVSGVPTAPSNLRVVSGP